MVTWSTWSHERQYDTRDPEDLRPRTNGKYPVHEGTAVSQPLLFCFRFVPRFTPHVKRKHRKFIEKINKHDLGMSRAISN
jgi:hypothetical protein